MEQGLDPDSHLLLPCLAPSVTKHPTARTFRGGNACDQGQARPDWSRSQGPGSAGVQRLGKEVDAP